MMDRYSSECLLDLTTLCLHLVPDALASRLIGLVCKSILTHDLGSFHAKFPSLENAPGFTVVVEASHDFCNFLFCDKLPIREGCRIGTHDLSIGRGTFINRGCVFEGAGRIEIGEHCLFGPEVMIVTSNHDIGEDGLVVREIFSDIGFDELSKLTGVPLIDGTQAARAA